MKKLMRVKLINWHRFTNTTIEFEKSTLISGENGAGKSTLLDAIQFVVICSTNYFNKAAHENGKRKLTGYIRCKTGRENRPYERTGEISAHIALEFYEEKRDKYFVVGAVVDSASEGQEKTARYLMDGVRLEDSLFFQGKTPKSINQFRTTNVKKIKQWCTTDKEARSMIKNRFGRIEDKFFRLIPKALAFRPIDDIKDFVYSYVLDEKEVNIDVLRENVRTYQDLQRTLENVKIRIGRLEKINATHDQAVDGLEKDRQYEYYLARVESDLILEEINRMHSEIQSDTYRLEEQNRQIESVRTEQAEKQTIRDDLRAELATDKDFLARDEQEKKLHVLERKKEGMLAERKVLQKSMDAAKLQIKKLLEVKDVDQAVKKYFEHLCKSDEEINHMLYIGTLLLMDHEDGAYQIYDPTEQSGDDYDRVIWDGVARTAEMTYNSISEDYGNGGNYISSLKPGESIQVNMAWIVNENDLNNMYLNLNGDGAAYEFSDSMLKTGLVDIYQ